MKKTLFALLTFAVLVGCQNPVTPDPPPAVEPVKVYLTGSESFTRVDAASALAKTDIYQWDTDADGTVDSPSVYYTGSNVAVIFDTTYGIEWTITIGGKTYMNDNWISNLTANPASKPTSKCFEQTTPNATDYTFWLVNTGAGLVWYMWDSVNEGALPVDSTVTFKGSNTATFEFGPVIDSTWKN